MANVIIPDKGRRADTEYVMETYGVDRKDPAMRDAAETVAARTNEAASMAGNRRKYF